MENDELSRSSVSSLCIATVDAMCLLVSHLLQKNEDCFNERINQHSYVAS